MKTKPRLFAVGAACSKAARARMSKVIVSMRSKRPSLRKESTPVTNSTAQTISKGARWAGLSFTPGNKTKKPEQLKAALVCENLQAITVHPHHHLRHLHHLHRGDDGVHERGRRGKSYDRGPS